MKKILIVILFLFGMYQPCDAATSTIYSNSSDCTMGYGSGTWAETHNAGAGNGGSFNNSGINFQVIAGFNVIWQIHRSCFVFTDSTIPIGADISSIRFYFKGSMAIVSKTICAQKGTFDSTPDNGSFDEFTGFAYGTVPVTTTDEYTFIEFDSTGISDFTIGGDTMVMLRDFDNDYPDIEGGTAFIYTGATSERTGTGSDPYLFVTYTPGSVSGTLKEYESDATGKEYSYIITNTTDDTVEAYGMASANGTWKEGVDSVDKDYLVFMYDKIDTDSGSYNPKLVGERIDAQ